jgi:predicted O-methyltransferase YrrM
MHAVLSTILATGHVTARDGSTFPLSSAITAEEGSTLQRLIRLHKPRTTLEIGLAYGVSALFICEALAEVSGEKHIAIDPVQHGWGDIGLLNLERAGLAPLVEFHGEPSHRALPALDAAGRRVDFAFIDGWHTFDYVMVDFFYVDRLLNVKGVLVLDDAWSYPAIRKLARYIATNRRYAPIATGGVHQASVKRRALDALVSPLRAGPLAGVARRLLRPDLMEPDSQLGLPCSDLVAFIKLADDVPGDGTNGSRRWDQHNEF